MLAAHGANFPSTLYLQFARSCNRDPRAPAVAAGPLVIDYAELSDRVDRIGQRIAEQGVRPGDRVGVLLRRDVDLPAALLACLGRGFPYVPMDPAYPDERLRYIAADADVSVVLCDDATATRRGLLGRPGLNVAGAGPIGSVLPSDGPGSDDIAYILDTSGSTGRPKGVMVSQANLADTSTGRPRPTGSMPVAARL